ncbi:PorT family protein [bacterium]|nr:PorT family protein [bacterium]
MHKSKIILFLLVFFTAYSAQSQGFEGALYLGANFSQVDGDQLGGYNKLGLNAGFAISRRLKKQDNWKLSFEMLYSQKGAKKVIDPDVGGPTLTLNYHYVEIPVLARYTWNEFVFYGGPSFGINVFNERDDNGFTSEEENLLSTEWALHLGGTYYLTERFGFDLRHSYSLVSVRDFPIVVNSPTWFGRAGWYNRLFTIAIRYNFGA